MPKSDMNSVNVGLTCRRDIEEHLAARCRKMISYLRSCSKCFHSSFRADTEALQILSAVIMDCHCLDVNVV